MPGNKTDQDELHWKGELCTLMALTRYSIGETQAISRIYLAQAESQHREKKQHGLHITEGLKATFWN